MKRMNTLTIVAIALTIVLFICTIDDFLSLHDINKDYVSKWVLQYLDTDTTKELPSWTNTELEWLSVKISFFIRFVTLIIFLFILLLLRKEIKNMYQKHPTT